MALLDLLGGNDNLKDHCKVGILCANRATSGEIGSCTCQCSFIAKETKLGDYGFKKRSSCNFFVSATSGIKNDTGSASSRLLHPVVACDALRAELHHYDQQNAVNQQSHVGGDGIRQCDKA